MSHNDDFDKILGDLDVFNNKVMKTFQIGLDEMLKEMRSGKIKGTWRTKEIKEPGVRGYIIEGRFWSDSSLEPLEPLKPWRRPPMPERPFDIKEADSEEMREPLTDIFEEDNAMKIYVELPGEDNQDIKLNVTGNNIEIRAKSFHKTINLQNKNVDTENVSTEYKNGVLQITLPKRERHHDKCSRKPRMV